MSPRHGYFTPDEVGVARDDLEDLIRGHQIVHLWMEGIERIGFVPGVPVICWELDNADVHVMAVFPDVTPASPFVYRVMWRMIQGPAFIRKSRVKYYSVGRPQMDLTEVQIKTRGQMIARAYREKEPGSEGGEIVVLDLTDGRRVIVEGMHSDEALPGQMLAGMEVRIEEPGRVTTLAGALPTQEAA